MTLVEGESDRLRRFGPTLRLVVRWIDRRVVAWVRRHPVWAASVFAVSLSLVIDSSQILLEGYRPTIAVWVLMVSSCSFFAFELVAGRYLAVIELRRQDIPPTYVALFAAAVTVPVVASFRTTLYWSVGATASTDQYHLVALTAVWPAAIGLTAFAAASGYATWRSSNRERGGA